MQSRSEACLQQSPAKRGGKPEAFKRLCVLVRHKDGIAMEIIAILLRFPVELPCLEVAVLDRVVMNGEKQVRLLRVSFLRSLRQADFQSVGIDKEGANVT